MRSFVDTNVLVYRFDRAEPLKRAKAKQILDTAEPGSLVISTQVLQEFYVTTTRQLAKPLSPAQASKAVGFLAALPTVGMDTESVIAGIRISRSFGLSLWDALIVHAAAAARCERILSEDLHDGVTIEGVRIDNPFRALNP